MFSETNCAGSSRPISYQYQGGDEFNPVHVFYVCSYITVWIQHPGEDSDTNLLQAYDEAYVKILFMVFCCVFYTMLIYSNF